MRTSVWLVRHSFRVGGKECVLRRTQSYVRVVFTGGVYARAIRVCPPGGVGEQFGKSFRRNYASSARKHDRRTRYYALLPDPTTGLRVQSYAVNLVNAKYIAIFNNV